MKSQLSAIAILALLLSGVATSPASASVPANGNYLCSTGAVSANGPSYSISAGVVLNGSGCVGAVVIPAGVLEIGNSAFRFASSLTSISLPASLSVIRLRAFEGTTSLTAISLPGGVTSIGEDAFRSSALTSIALPNSLTTIGAGAFLDAIALTSVTTSSGSSLQTIGETAFQGATALNSFLVPSTVRTIEPRVFSGTASLTSISFAPNSQLTSIGDSAFRNAVGLVSIELPESVTSIGEDSFRGATSLVSVLIPARVTVVGEDAFWGASALSAVTFGSNSQLNRIESGAFLGNTSLRAITIPPLVDNIGSSAFRDSTSLTSIRFLGNSPTTVGSSAFAGLGSSPKAVVNRLSTGFGSAGSIWNGLTVTYPTVTLTLSSDGTDSNQEVEPGLTPEVPNLTRPGFNLAGWSTTQGSAAQFAADLSDFIMGSQAQTLFAVWEEDSAQAQSATEELAHPFSGPLLLNLNRSNFEANLSSTLTFQGVRLNRIDSVLLDGKRLEIISKSRSNITLALPAMALGSYTLVIESKSGRLALSRFIVVR